MITIDEMQSGDWRDFARIDRECFALPWSEKSFEDEYKNDIAVYFSARDDGECIGYAGFWNVSGEGDITNIAVREKYRRKGIGGELLRAVINKSVSLGLSIITLEVRVSNTAALALYKKYGFEIIGKRKNYYSDNNEDAYIMKKTLSCC